MTRLRGLPVLLALCSLTFSANAQQTPFAFVDVNVVLMDREAILRHYTVLVKDGKIVAVESFGGCGQCAEARGGDGSRELAE